MSQASQALDCIWSLEAKMRQYMRIGDDSHTSPKIKRKGVRDKQATARRERWAEMHKGGQSVANIAKTECVNVNTVYTAFRVLGIQPPRSKKSSNLLSKEDRAIAIGRKNSGEKWAAIAESYGMDGRSLRRLCQVRGKVKYASL